MQNHPLSLIGFYDRFLSKWHMTFYYLYKNKRKINLIYEKCPILNTQDKYI